MVTYKQLYKDMEHYGDILNQAGCWFGEITKGYLETPFVGDYFIVLQTIMLFIAFYYLISYWGKFSTSTKSFPQRMRELNLSATEKWKIRKLYLKTFPFAVGFLCFMGILWVNWQHFLSIIF